MSRLRGFLHSVFHDGQTATPNLPAHTGRRTATEGRASLRGNFVGASHHRALVLKRSGYRPAHGSPNSFATFPQTPLHRRVLIHLGVLEIFPRELIFGAELLVGLV